MILPANLRSLLDEIRTADGLEVMCMVARPPLTSWAIDEIAERLGFSLEVAASTVSDLAAAGLLRRDSALRFSCADAVVDRNGALQAVLRLYDTDRAGLFRALTGLAIERLKRSAAHLFLNRPGDKPDEP